MVATATSYLGSPSLHDLRALPGQLRCRRHATALEQVATEVGGSVNAEIEASLWEATVVIRGGRIVGLPLGTYRRLLRAFVRRRMAEAADWR